MSKQRITISLTEYQIAKGIQILKQIEPRYKLTNLSDMIKIIYNNYLAKMNPDKTDTNLLDSLNELQAFLAQPPSKSTTISLESLIELDSKIPTDDQFKQPS